MPNISRRDLTSVISIGAAVGLLIQLILANNLPARDAAFLSLPARIGIFCFFLLLAPFALWVAKAISGLFRGVYQFAQFAAVGTLNSFIDVGVLNAELYLFAGGGPVGNLPYALFKGISFLFATTNSFFWNKYWTFDSRGKAHAGQVTGFYGVAFVGWILNVGSATFTKALGPASSHVWAGVVAPLVGIAVSFAWDFAGYKYFVFGPEKT